MNNRHLAWIVIASQFAPPFMFSGVAVAIPAMGADLNAGASALGLVETLFLAGGAAFLLPIGKLADLTDKNSLYKFGLIGFCLSSVAIAFLSSMPWILAFRFFQGLTSALFSTTGPAILADIVPREHRGKAYGTSLGVLYMGLTLGPIVSGYLVEFLGWRAVFWASALVMGVAVLLIQFSLPTRWKHAAEPVDWWSAALVSVGILCGVAGSSILEDTASRMLAIGFGGLMLALFLFRQFRLEDPLVDLRAINTNHVLRNALSVQSLLYLNVVTTTFLLSVYLQISLRESADTAGSVIAVGTIVMALGAPIAGRFVDRFAPFVMTSVGVALVLVSTLLATQMSMQSALWWVAMVVMIQGAGFALFSSTNMTTIMNSVGAETVSMASALGATARRIGMLSGMMLVGFLISLSYGRAAVASDPTRFVDVMSLSFSILAGFTLAALIVSIASAIAISRRSTESTNP